MKDQKSSFEIEQQMKKLAKIQENINSLRQRMTANTKGLSKGLVRFQGIIQNTRRNTVGLNKTRRHCWPGFGKERILFRKAKCIPERNGVPFRNEKGTGMEFENLFRNEKGTGMETKNSFRNDLGTGMGSKKSFRNAFRCGKFNFSLFCFWPLSHLRVCINHQRADWLILSRVASLLSSFEFGHQNQMFWMRNRFALIYF